MSAQALRAGPASPEPTVITATARPDPLERVGLWGLMGLAPAVLVYLSFNAGGYFPSAPGIVAVVLAQALVLRTLLAERPFEGFSRALAVPLGALVLYAAWTLASAGWAHATARVLDSFDRTLLYVLALALFGSVRYSRERIGWLVRALVLGGSAVCLIGLLSRVLPQVWHTDSSFFADRLNYPLTYWNALGMLAAVTLILGFHLSADRAEHWSVRIAAAALLPGVATALLLTFSRGSMGVLAVGLLAYCLLARLHTLPGALLATVPTTAIALHTAWDATALATVHPTSPLAIHQGHHVASVVGLCMLIAGLLRAVLLGLDRGLAQLRFVRRPPRQGVRVGIGAGATALALAVVLALGGGGLAQREFDKFTNGNKGPHVAQVRDRLTDPANNGRLSLWQAALDIYRTQKLHGTGAGTYQQFYPRYRTESLYVTDAHSLYLQSLSELGIVGFLLILIVVLGIMVGLAHRVRGPDRGLYAALFAAFLAWAIHQAFDWDWQMPAVTIGLFILAGLALARRSGGRVAPRGLPTSRTLLALGWLVLAVAPLLVSVSYARVQESGRRLEHGDCPGAKRAALSSLKLSAERPQAYAIIGVCDLEQGFAQAAQSAMTQAALREPGSWEDQYWLAVARAGAGTDPRGAIHRAIVLNPDEPVLKEAVERLAGADPREWESAAAPLLHRALASGKFSITSL